MGTAVEISDQPSRLKAASASQTIVFFVFPTKAYPSLVAKDFLNEIELEVKPRAKSVVSHTLT